MDIWLESYRWFISALFSFQGTPPNCFGCSPLVLHRRLDYLTSSARDCQALFWSFFERLAVVLCDNECYVTRTRWRCQYFFEKFSSLEDCKFNCRIVLLNFGILYSRSIHIICSLITEDFAWIVVHPIFDPFQLSWFQRAEIRSFRQKSAQNTVSVLVAPALSTAERMCVVHFIALCCLLQPFAI